MVQQLLFINLFFVPLVPLYILYRNRQKPLEPNLDLLFQYGIIVTCNVPLTKVFVVLIRKIIGISISMGSGSYTLAAFLPTIVAILWYKIYPHWKGKTVSINFSAKEKLKLSLIVNLFFVFTILVFNPYDVFFANSSDFSFSFSDFWWIMASFALLVFVVLMIVSMIVPPKAFVIIESIVFSFTLLSYIQRMFLNLYITSVIGVQLNTREHFVWGCINLLIWLGVITAILFLFYTKRNQWKSVLCIVSAGLIFVQGVALTSLLVTEDLSGVKSVTTEGLYELASENNIIVFILDYYDFSYVEAVRESEPDFYDRLEGFTYFDNTSSVFGKTYPSIPYLMTASELDEFHIEPWKECVNKAISESTFLPDLKNLGYEIGVYTDASFVGTAGSSLINNYSNVKHVLSYPETLKGMVNCSLYFEMPYFLKPFFWTYEIDSTAVLGNQYVRDDAKFYDELMEKKLTVSNAEYAYKFIHMRGGHPPYVINENCELVPGGVQGIQQWKGCVNIVYEYLEQMKALGKYDNSTIIITTDHGNVPGVDLEGAVAPIMFVKPAYAPAQNLVISHAPVSHTDIFPTIIEAAGGNYDAYGKPVFSIDENEKRTRIFHFTHQTEGLDSDVLTYEIPQNVKDFANWRMKSKKTILKSKYAVYNK